LKNISFLKTILHDEFVTYKNLANGVTFIIADSNYCEIETNASDWTEGSYVKFDFSQNDGLDIDDEFSGDLDVTVEVLCFNKNGEIIWAEDEDDITVARVTGTEIL